MRRGDLRDEGLDPQLRINTKIQLQRSLCWQSVWLITISILFGIVQTSPNISLSYNLCLGQIVLTVGALLIWSYNIMTNIYKRPFTKTLRLKMAKNITEALMALLNSTLFVFAYGDFSFYREVASTAGFIAQILTIILYVYLCLMSLIAGVLIIIFVIQIALCQVNLYALCCCCWARRIRDRRQRRDRNRQEGLNDNDPEASLTDLATSREQDQKALSSLSRLFGFQEIRDHDECTICLEEFHDEDRVTPLPCDIRHYFHSKCIEKWFKKHNYCPLCKKVITRHQMKDVTSRLSMSSPSQLHERELLSPSQHGRQAAMVNTIENVESFDSAMLES